MIDLNKKGLVILTHYRSGGTLLRQFIVWIIQFYLKVDVEEIGEIDFTEGSYENDTTVDYKKLLKNTFEQDDGKFRIVQLNNPLVISYLSSIEYFKYLVTEFNVIHLERKNVKQALLSLPLWEKYLSYKELVNLEDEDNIHSSFYEYCERRPINYKNIYTGIHFATPNIENYRNYLDYQLMLLTNRLHLNRYIRDKYSLKSFYYEDFEKEPTKDFLEYFNSLVKDIKFIKDNIERCKNAKIKYLHEDYLLYFDNKVKEVFNYWNL